MSEGEQELESPRIAALRAAVVADGAGSGAVAEFWRRAEAEGTPLVEPDPDSEEHRLVTFVWRASSPAIVAVELKGNPRWRSPLDSWLKAATFARDGLETRQLQQLADTDVWFDTSRVRADLRMTYTFAEREAAGVNSDPWEPGALDPFATASYPDETALDVPSVDPDWSTYRTSAVDLRPLPTLPTPTLAGVVTEHRLIGTSADDRRVWIYEPPGASDEPLPVMVLHDGWNWAAHTPIAPILDHLIAERKIPPLCVVMHESADRDELACRPAFTDFLADELLPWAGRLRPLTDDPARTIVAGQSYGGLNAAYSALRRPDRFGHVLSQSGSFWWREATPFDEEFGWLISEFVRSPRLPVRFYLDVGLLESYMVPTNRHFRDVLLAKEYDVTYREFHGDHSWFCWRGTVGDGLESLTRDW